MNEYEILEDSRDRMVAATNELKTAGRAWAMAEHDYQAAKARRTAEMRADGLSATEIQLRIKGDPEVCELILARDLAKVEYDATNKAIDTYKLDARLAEGTIERDWQQARRM